MENKDVRENQGIPGNLSVVMKDGKNEMFKRGAAKKQK